MRTLFFTLVWRWVSALLRRRRRPLRRRTRRRRTGSAWGGPPSPAGSDARSANPLQSPNRVMSSTINVPPIWLG